MTQRTGIPGKGFQDTGHAAPLGPGKQTLTSQLDNEIAPPSRGDAPGTTERPRGGGSGR